MTKTLYRLAATEPTISDSETRSSTETAVPAEKAESGILGVSLESFVIQLITFILVFALLKKFAFNRIVKILDERHKVIDEGVRHGQNMKKEREDFEKQTGKIINESRHRADEIIGDAQKEGREIIREAEKAAHKKSEALLVDAEVRVEEEAKQAKRKLEREIVELVSEVTEALVEEKVDAKKDADLIDKALKKGMAK
ncbi:MAG: F0F1 ATP synthase subunit B [bacterium]|nr:F0F1 ATP synthase subunit B [bacterium]